MGSFDEMFGHSAELSCRWQRLKIEISYNNLLLVRANSFVAVHVSSDYSNLCISALELSILFKTDEFL